jgi:tRNA pseudouridine13 synthase
VTDAFVGIPRRFLTTDEPGIGGRLKIRPEDFLVEELPLYEPCGSGEHIYLFIEKIERPTLSVIREIAKRLRISVGAIGYAGMKDKVAVTRQLLSIHLTEGDPHRVAEELDLPGVRILWSDRHRNKLRVGHLRGNRFSIRIREVEISEVTRVNRILQRLQHCGVPNFIGEQRFGYHQTNHELGRLYLLRDWKGFCDLMLGPSPHDGDHAVEARNAYAADDLDTAVKTWPSGGSTETRILASLAAGRTHQQAVHDVNESSLRFFITAFQSAIFNRILAQRIDQGDFERLIEGDIVGRTDDSHNLFRIGPEELVDESVVQRFGNLELSPTGPLWGSEMRRADGAVDAAELAALHATGISIDHFADSAIDMRGTRRSLRLAVFNTEVSAGSDDHGPYLRIDFELPRGGFATTVLDEVMKAPQRDHPWGS